MSESDLLSVLTTGGPSALLAVIIVLLVIGEFRLKREVVDRDAQIVMWRAAHEREQAARAEQERALHDSLESVRSVAQLLDAVQRGRDVR